MMYKYRHLRDLFTFFNFSQISNNKTICSIYQDTKTLTITLNPFKFSNVTSSVCLFSLGENEIGDDGAVAMAQALATNTSLEKLE